MYSRHRRFFVLKHIKQTVGGQHNEPTHIKQHETTPHNPTPHYARVVGGDIAFDRVGRGNHDAGVICVADGARYAERAVDAPRAEPHHRAARLATNAVSLVVMATPRRCHGNAAYFVDARFLVGARRRVRIDELQ